MVTFSQIEEVIAKNPHRRCICENVNITEPSYILKLKEMIEKPIEKVIEKPVENPIEKPIEKVIEKTIEKSIEKVIEKPVEKPVEKVIQTKAIGFIQKRQIDPIVLGISEKDFLYMGASDKTKHQMECEESIRIEGLIDKLYSEEGGRSRGWTKKMLEAFIKPRCASGGNLFELEKAKVSFDWEKIFSDKETSAILDFLCLAKNIRVVVWKDEFHFGLWPAADHAVIEKIPTLIHIALVDGKGYLTNGSFNTIENLFEYVKTNEKVGWIPALACSNLLSNKTVDELNEEGKKVHLDVSDLKKSQKIAMIAAKRRMLTLGLKD